MEIVEGWEADYQAVGAGNAGTVLKGKFNATGRKVAIKVRSGCFRWRILVYIMNCYYILNQSEKPSFIIYILFNLSV